MDINEIAEKHYNWVEQMGWHNKTVLEALALIASEVGEASREIPKDHPAQYAIAAISRSVAKAVNQCRQEQPSQKLGEELADIILRTIDLAKWQGIDLSKEIQDKMNKNEKNGTRGRRI